MLPIAIAALLLTPPGTPAGGFHWKRIITPPPGAGTEQACVVLDAVTFANAAPALGDLRLFQDGTELAYVIEQSYDERALDSGTTPDDDRSEYEAVYVGQMQPRQPAGTAGNGQPSGGLLGYQASTSLEAHIPVERIRFDPAPAMPVHLQISAMPSGDPGPFRTETAEHTFNSTHPAWAFTLGANLQHAARVLLIDDTPGQRSERVLLEMRRRSLCYQPRSVGPLTLYLGGGQGMSAKTYGLASGFSTTAERPYATLGPLEPNPDLQAARRHPFSRPILAIAILGITLLVTLLLASQVLGKGKGRPQATP